MGLFNKLKNALFEEEEIEIPIKETPENKKPTQVIKEDSVEKKPKPEIEKKNIDALLDEQSERDLFKAENTFKFPEFDEEEFKSSYKPPIEKVEKKEPVITPKESFERVKPVTYEYDKKPKPKRKEPVKKEPVEDTNTKKSFRPSPIISPVYGVLDKNYKKEDIITVKEQPKKKFDVDAIRKKAFGTLEDDIERSFETPKESFYNKNNESIDDLLSDSAEEKIDISYEKRAGSREARNERHSRIRAEETEEVETVPSNTRSNRHKMEEQEEERYHYAEQEEASNLQVLDEDSTKSEEQRFEEDTLENDLFDLIDSMYDNREDEEE